MADETIDCRLDQIPEAEGCPPCCRRLPPGANDRRGEPTRPSQRPAIRQRASPGENDAPDTNRCQDSTSLCRCQQPDDPPEPLSAAQIPSAEFQFGVAGRNEQVRALVADGRLRRLPIVDASRIAGSSTASIGNVTVDTSSDRRQRQQPHWPGRQSTQIRTAEQTSSRVRCAASLIRHNRHIPYDRLHLPHLGTSAATSPR